MDQILTAQKLLISQLSTDKLLALSNLISIEINKRSLNNDAITNSETNDNTHVTIDPQGNNCVCINGYGVSVKQTDILDMCSRYGQCEEICQEIGSITIRYYDYRDYNDFVDNKKIISGYIKQNKFSL